MADATVELSQQPSLVDTLPPNVPIVEFENVCLRFDENEVLRGVSFTVERGETRVILGPAGGGKSVLLKHLIGLEEPDSGEILIAGERMNDVPTYKREIGMMFQNYALFPHMNVAGNVAYGLKVRGVSKQERDRRVEAVVPVEDPALHPLGVEGLCNAALAGSVYPIPDPPVQYFPYGFLVYMAIGIIWIMSVYRRKPKAAEVVQADLERSHARFI